jgi:hypothetical protein
MRHFRLIRQGIDTREVEQELARHDRTWFAQTGRQATSFAQRDTHAIPLRGLRKSRILGRRRRDVHESRYTSLAREFPATVRLMEAFAAEVDGTLGRAKLALLPPGKRVLPHVDRGEYYRCRDRYHLVVKSPRGSVLRAGGEEARLQEGELWWFDNKAVHEAANDSGVDRIHLIFDVLPPTAADGEAGPLAEPDPALLLRDALGQAEEEAIEGVARAVRTYLAVRHRPELWKPVLSAHGRVAEAATSPIAVLVSLHWPDTRAARRRRYESAVAWSLAKLDLGLIGPGDVADAIRSAGGLDVIDHEWRRQREDILYADLVADGRAGAAHA